MTPEKKGFFRNTYVGFAIKNIFIAIIIVVVIGLTALFLTKTYTHHGQNEVVPNVKGIELNEATGMLKRHHLRVEIIDSTYVKDKPLGTVLEQTPAPQSRVKPNRTIYLIINSTSVRKLPTPDLRDLSLRQGQAMLLSMGMKVAKVEYAPSEYKDLILEIKYNGKTLSPGSKIPEGSQLVIVAGSGLGHGVAGLIPNVLGWDMLTALNAITSSSFLVGNISYDQEPNGDESEYIVYHQYPSSNDSISAGTPIDLWFTKDRNKRYISPTPQNNHTGSEQSKSKEKAEDIEEFF